MTNCMCDEYKKLAESIKQGIVDKLKSEIDELCKPNSIKKFKDYYPEEHPKYKIAEFLIKKIRKYAANAARESKKLREIGMERIIKGLLGSTFFELSREENGKYLAFKSVLRLLGDKD